LKFDFDSLVIRATDGSAKSTAFQAVDFGASENHAFRAAPLEKAMDGPFQQPANCRSRGS
jgi:hypothetical protein